MCVIDQIQSISKQRRNGICSTPIQVTDKMLGNAYTSKGIKLQSYIGLTY